MDEPIDLTGSDDEQAAQRSTNDTTYGSGDESDRPKKKLKRSRGESPEVPDSEASFKAESKPVVEYVIPILMSDNVLPYSLSDGQYNLM